jgi:hypothetical protein
MEMISLVDPDLPRYLDIFGWMKTRILSLVASLVM